MKNLTLITGSTDGIGKQTAFDLAALGFEVIIHGRNEKRCQQVVEEILELYPNNFVEYVVADFANPKAIKRMSDELHEKYKSLSVLINNAGIIEKKKIINKGIERTFMVNHLAPFYLSLLLLDLLSKGKPSRIVNVSSTIHAAKIDFDNLQSEKGFDTKAAYSMSKLANILFSSYLAKQLKGKKITVNSLHPGVANTKLLRAISTMQGSHVSLCSKTSVYLANSEEVYSITGKYFTNNGMAKPKPISLDPTAQKQLWEASEKLLNINTKNILKKI